MSNYHEIINRYSSHNVAKAAIQNAKDLLVKANENPNHYFRLSRAFTASSAFFQLFLANTGMNLEQAVSLNWQDDFEIANKTTGIPNN